MATPTLTKVQSTGIVLVVLGFAAFIVSGLFDGGFFRGFFQGATVALLVCAAFFFGLAVRSRKAGDTAGMWRPSDDVRDDR